MRLQVYSSPRVSVSGGARGLLSQPDQQNVEQMWRAICFESWTCGKTVLLTAGGCRMGMRLALCPSAMQYSLMHGHSVTEAAWSESVHRLQGEGLHACDRLTHGFLWYAP